MRTAKYMLTAGAAALLLAGCGGSGTTTESTAQRGSGAVAPAQGGEIAANTKDAAGAPAAGAARQDSAPQAPAQQVKLAPESGRAIVYTADLQVRAANVDTAATRAKQLVTAAGGHVSTETSSSEPVGATITFKIPSERYGAVLDQLAGRLGTRLSLRRQAEDVTEEVADVDSRVRSAEATLKSFRTLLSRAETVGEVISVEQEISQRQADLESLQARQKSLAEQTSFGTVTLRLEAPPGPGVRSGGGFLGGLRSGWEAFTGVLAGLAVALGWLLPFLVPLALAGALGRRLRGPARRYAQRRRATVQHATPE